MLIPSKEASFSPQKAETSFFTRKNFFLLLLPLIEQPINRTVTERLAKLHYCPRRQGTAAGSVGAREKSTKSECIAPIADKLQLQLKSLEVANF